MSKILRIVISCILSVSLFVVATMLHNTDVVSSGIISGTTQVQILSSNTGFMYYVISLVLITLATVLGHKIPGGILGEITSWVLAIVRVIGSLALISGGTSIFVFENKIGQIIQFVVVLYVIVLQICVSSVHKKTKSFKIYQQSQEF